jgi:hypothetical protein
MAIDGGKSAFDSMAEDAHPIQPFHSVIRSEGFKPSHSEHTPEGNRVNHYSRPNPGGGQESVELHHNRMTGKVNSITKSGAEENTLSHSNNSSPAKMHRNIHEASYRAPKDVPKAHTSGQIREHQEKMEK